MHGSGGRGLLTIRGVAVEAGMDQHQRRMAAAETRDLWRKTSVWLGTYDTPVMDAMAYDRAAQALRLPLAQAAPGYGGATDAAPPRCHPQHC